MYQGDCLFECIRSGGAASDLWERGTGTAAPTPRALAWSRYGRSRCQPLAVVLRVQVMVVTIGGVPELASYAESVSSLRLMSDYKLLECRWNLVRGKR